MGIFLISSLVSTFLFTIQPVFYKQLIDTVSLKEIAFIFPVIITYSIVRFAAVFFDSLTIWLGDRVLLPAARDARLKIFAKVQNLDFAYHLSRSTGSLISTFKRGDSAFFNLFHAININLLDVSFSFLLICIIFFRLDSVIALILIATLSVNLAISRYLISYNIRTRAEFNKEEDNISETIVDNLINFETVKLFAQERQERRRLWDNFIPWLRTLWSYSNSFRLIDISVGIVLNIGILAILLYLWRQLSLDNITVGDFLMVIGFLADFSRRFYRLIYEVRNIAKNFVDIQRYLLINDEKEQVLDPAKPKKLTSVSGEIVFDHLTFQYPETKKAAVTNFDLTIRPGQSVAFVGQSGVGKSTIIKLLMRFFDPQQGRITIDGVDIKQFSKSYLRSLMGVVPQEPILFNHSIGYNITYGRPRATKREIIAAAKLANLHDFITSLPKGYDTAVGERGIKLSGGQKQRLAIARMILSDPDIIVFDEATSQLDSESERLIQEAFWKVAKNKTTLVIAHRLSTVARADKIIVLRQGRVAEIGSHRELLMKKNGLYRRYWHLQSLN